MKRHVIFAIALSVAGSSSVFAQLPDDPESIAALKECGVTLVPGPNGNIAEVLMSGPTITDEAVKELKGLYSVTRLHFFGAHITDAAFANFAHMTDLSHLVVRRQWYVPGAPGKVVSVREPRIAITGEGISHLGNTKLKVLSISGTQIDDRVIEHVLKLKHLERVALRGNEMTDEGLFELRDKLPREVDVRVPGENSF